MTLPLKLTFENGHILNMLTTKVPRGGKDLAHLKSNFVFEISAVKTKHGISFS